MYSVSEAHFPSCNQVKRIQSEEKGETNVEVQVFDETGRQPVACEMIWAWTRKREKDQNA